MDGSRLWVTGNKALKVINRWPGAEDAIKSTSWGKPESDRTFLSGIENVMKSGLTEWRSLPPSGELLHCDIFDTTLRRPSANRKGRYFLAWENRLDNADLTRLSATERRRQICSSSRGINIESLGLLPQLQNFVYFIISLLNKFNNLTALSVQHFLNSQTTLSQSLTYLAQLTRFSRC